MAKNRTDQKKNAARIISLIVAGVMCVSVILAAVLSTR